MTKIICIERWQEFRGGRVALNPVLTELWGELEEALRHRHRGQPPAAHLLDAAYRVVAHLASVNGPWPELESLRLPQLRTALPPAFDRYEHLPRIVESCVRRILKARVAQFLDDQEDAFVSDDLIQRETNAVLLRFPSA